MLPLLLPFLGSAQVKRCVRDDLHGGTSLAGCTAFTSEFEQLSTPDIEELTRALSRSPSLSFLSLRTKGFLNNDDAERVLDAAAENQNLDSLIFRVSAPLSAAAAGALAGAISANQRLVTLDLRETSLGDDGFALIADALAESTSIQHLLLGGNGITDAAPLVKVITANNKALETIDFSNNRWGDAGASALAEALTLHAGALRDVVFQDHPAVVGDGIGRDAVVRMANEGKINVWTSRRESRRKSWVGLPQKDHKTPDKSEL